MAVLISLLRGINVGGHQMIRMEDLRALYHSLGLQDARSYVQSGNVVFRTDETDLTSIGHRIEAAIEGKYGFRPAVILRTPDELRGIIARNPFAGREEVLPNRLLVSFLAGDPGQEIRDKVLQIEAEPEELRFHGKELYIHYPNGMARPKLSLARVEKILRTPSTGRNWNTVLKLLELAESMENVP